MNSMNISQRRQSGFTIIEALISLIIMGFGILSLSGMQLDLSRNADDAKQRTEAVRLAQEKIEYYRSYTGIAATLIGQGTVSGSALNWDALVNGSDTITTNAVYARSWTFGGANSDPMRNLTVGVVWTDRAGQTQTVTLSTVISKTDAADSGFLGFPLPENTNLKRPKNRNLNIPIPAIDIGNGRSAVAFGGDKYVLFSNISGDVVQICTPTLGGTPTTAEIVAALNIVSSCTIVNGYIVAGYVTRDTSVSNTDWNAIKNGLGIDHSGIDRNAAGSAAITCQFGDAINPNSGAIIDNVKYYLCVIPLQAPISNEPIDHGPYNWSGTIRIAGPSVWHGSGNKYYVCRYEYSAASDLTDANERNVQRYVEVNKSIDQQNYLVVTTTNATSPTTPACPASMNVTGVSTGVLHQDCRSASNTNHGANCPLLSTTPQYTITYNGNGATSGTAPTDTSLYTSGSTVTVLGNAGALTKTGYSFAGWNTREDVTGTSYAAGTVFTITANTTLYAQWSSSPTYSITYNGNGNTGGTVPTDANSPYTSGSTIAVLGNTGNLTKTGYTFGGWNTASDGNGTAYAAGANLSLVANATLYAQWVVLQTYTVSYNGNSNTTGTAPSSATYTSGTTVTIMGNTGILQRTGYSFNGWNTASNGSGTNYSPGATFTIAGTTELFAKWQQITLGTPQTKWGTGNNPRSFSWTEINGASSYDVYSCSGNAGTSCTPGGVPTNQTGLSVQPSPATNVAICYKVIAKGSPYGDSAASTTLCVSRDNNYSYSP